jgi:hypothetical protein
MYNLVPKVELDSSERSATTVTAPCDCHHTLESARTAAWMWRGAADWSYMNWVEPIKVWIAKPVG